MPSRLSGLSEWYRFSMNQGYQFYSVENYWRLTNGGLRPPPPKTIVLRHDVDVDIGAAKAMFSIEHQLGITSSYYFRLSTADLPLMRAIAASGGEASYHYEELATEAKTRKLRTVADVEARLQVIRERFSNNLQSLRSSTQLPMNTVAAHGDWMNRRLRLPNTAILESLELRLLARIAVEAYDADLLTFVTARYADKVCPVWWRAERIIQGESGGPRLLDVPQTPTEAVCAGIPVIYVVLHPEQWRRGPRLHFKEQVKRIREGLEYRFWKPMHDPATSKPHPVTREVRLKTKANVVL